MLDPPEDPKPGRGARSEAIILEHLAFQASEKTLRHGIVVAVTDASHREPHAELTAAGAGGNRSVFAPVIGVMNHGASIAPHLRHLQCREHRRTADAIS